MTSAQPIVRLTIRSISYRRYRRMAIPMATGTRPIDALAAIHAHCPYGCGSSVAAKNIENARTSTEPNHLSCLRSTSVPRRYRRTAARMPAGMQMNDPMPPMSISACGSPPRAGMPSGLSKPACPRAGRASSRLPKSVAAAENRSTAATTAHRRDISRPSGNSSGTSITRKNAGKNSSPRIAPASVPGREPSNLARLRNAHSWPRSASPMPSPTASSTHPTRLSGRRVTRSAPTSPQVAAIPE